MFRVLSRARHQRSVRDFRVCDQCAKVMVMMIGRGRCWNLESQTGVIGKDLQPMSSMVVCKCQRDTRLTFAFATHPPSAHLMPGRTKTKWKHPMHERILIFSFRVLDMKHEWQIWEWCILSEWKDCCTRRLTRTKSSIEVIR